MKQILLIIAVVALVGCASTPTNWNWISDSSDPNNVKIEAAIRDLLEKPAGELTKADLEKVTSLRIEHKQLTNVKGLEKLTKLTRLNLFGNQLTSVEGLEKLTELQLAGNVKGLERLTQLKALYLKGNPALTKAQIAELQKALPKCRIISNPTK